MESYYKQSKLSAQIERIKSKDIELLNELELKLEPAPRVARMSKVKMNEDVTGGIPHINLRPEAFFPPKPMPESIVLAHLRPVLIIRDNKIVPEFSGPEVAVWKDRLMLKESVLNAVIPSVGRVEINNNAVYNWVGTGWLIDTDIIVTNRHVADIFCKNKEGFSFKVGYPSGFQTPKIDFLEEDQRTTQLEFDVDSVLWIAENDPKQPDVAFMRVKRAQNALPLPKFIELADTIEEGEVVVTIGYPARDPNIPDQEVVLSIFGNVYDKKRLAPGEIVKVGDRELEHDCSTLGGNSGSAVISLLTGKAVGLHFAGLYLQSNFAVPSFILKDLLQKLKSGKLPRMSTTPSTPSVIESNKPQIITNPQQTIMSSQTSGKYTIEASIPIKITLEIGGNIHSIIQQIQLSSPSDVKSGDNYEQAVELAKQTLSKQHGVVKVRKGYRFRRGWITDERVIVVEVQNKQSLPDLKSSGKQLIPQEFSGVGVDVRTASLYDQLDFMGVIAPLLEAVPKPGVYREPPVLQLDPVTDERIKAIFHVSPDSGWPNLRDFFGRIKQSLTATIYEWEAEHLSNALYTAIHSNKGHLKMVTQKAGTKVAVEEMQQKLGSDFEHIWASVGSGMIVPSAYHIKVASRDQEEFWLSSGNWKNSNQADINPAGEHSKSITPLREHNREWHVIMENATLAKLFQDYIDWDFEEAKRVPLEEAMALPEIYLFVPEPAFEKELERRVAVQYFEPLIVDKVLNVQPLLTPDRDHVDNRLFISFATKLIDSATSTIDIENQSFSILEENDPQFESFFNVLLRKQKEGIKIRIIFRDPREFNKGAKGEAALHTQLERLKDFGINTDPIKVQEKCHTKAIIVDSDKPETAAVLFGSHNLTTSGALYNRDASLLIKDQEVAQYFQAIFNFDWEVLAKQTAEESIGGVRVAQPGEETPVGFRKVTLSELLAEN
jgi:S1-C subfamily serine protease